MVNNIELLLADIINASCALFRVLPTSSYEVSMIITTLETGS